MPMLDLAVRFQDTYRVRLGDLPAKNRPRALTDQLRVTAPGPEAPAAFAEVYGSVDNAGVQPWEDEKSNDRFQVYLPITALPIWIMPGNVLDQWWEMYKGKVCDRRCDGQVETLTKVACMCEPDMKARAGDKNQCSPMTRFSIMCPEVESVLGSGSLVTHSLIAAETFPAALWLAGPWLSKNVPVAATLRTITHKGRTTFTFPTIEVGGPVDRTPELDAGHRPAQIDAGASHPPALETGSQRSGPPPAAPPVPFDESNELIVDRDEALAIKAEAMGAGLTAADVARVVGEVTGGSTNVITKVLKAQIKQVEDALVAAAHSAAVPA